METVFRQNRLRGRRFFSLTKAGRLKQELTKFDPTIEKMVLKPKPTMWERIRETT
jgi:hypothetical protein